MANGTASEQLGAAVLILGGLALVIGGLLNWFLPEDPRVTVVSDRAGGTAVTVMVSPSMVVATQDPSSESTRMSTKGEVASSTRTNVAKSGTKTTTTSESTTTTLQRPVTKRTITTAPPPGRRDAGVTVALLGFGFVSLLAGAFFPKVSAITLPGGGGITLAANVGVAAKELETRVTKLEEASKKQANALRALAKKVEKHPPTRRQP